MRTLVLLFTAVIALSYTSYSQKTGSFDETIMFNGEQRTLSFYVPLDYNADNKYELVIGLHGLGDTGPAYRDALITTLSWNTLLPNTIFVFPDGGEDQSSDFYAPLGDEQIITEAIDLVSSEYNISVDDIILQGFSLGGRSALKFGLEHTDMFKGLILNTPAVQGVLDYNNVAPYTQGYAYQNASKIPIAMVHGAEDATYLGFDIALYHKLIENNGIIRSGVIANMPHTVPPISLMIELFNFIDSPVREGVDIELVELDIPQRTCSENIKPRLLVRNSAGKSTGTFLLNVDVNGTDYEYFVDADYGAYEAEWLELDIPSLILNPAVNNINISLKSITSGETDIRESSNMIADSIYMYVSQMTKAFSMGFEDNEVGIDDWYIEESGDVLSWGLDNEVAKVGTNSLSKFSTLFLFASFGLSEDLLSPFFDLTQIEEKSVSFDYAFNYHKYTPPYFTEDVVFTDTLRIYISNDCGETYELLYEKAGADLATATEPLTNALSINDAYYVPKANEWKTEKIDLSDFSFQSNSTLKFSIVSGQGGTIYLDNIRIGDASTSVELVTEKTFTISPNPAKSVLKIDDINSSIGTKYILTSINGSIIDSFDIKDATNINIDKLHSGVYFITKSSGNTHETQKFIKE